MLFPRLETGFDLIDNLWHGLFQGRTYLLTGPVNSGKTTFCLQFAARGLSDASRSTLMGLASKAKGLCPFESPESEIRKTRNSRGCPSKEKVVYFTDERPEDVLLRAEALQFDLSSSLELGDFLIFNLELEDKGTSISDTPELGGQVESDQLLHKAIGEIIQIVEKESPTRLILDQLTPLLQFEDFDTLIHDIKELIYSCEKFKATTIITVGEPFGNQAARILEFLSSVTTATIKLFEGSPEEKRSLSLNARLGHYPDFYSSPFVIRTGIGLTGIETITPPATPSAPEPVITAQVVQPPEQAELPVTEKETVPETSIVKPSEEASLEIPGQLDEAKTVETVPCKVTPSSESKLLEADLGPPQAFPEYPIRDLDRDDFTGLFNFDGLLHIITQAIEKKNPFSLMIVAIIKGVDSRAKRLLLSHKLASAVKAAIDKPAPVGRYSDKIIVFLDKTHKPQSQAIAAMVKNKAFETLTTENEILKDLEIVVDVYTYPEDIRTIREVETIVQTGGEQ